MSADVADTVRPPSPRTAAPSSRTLHRWFFAGAAFFLVATVLVGFVPSSFERVAAAAGQRAPLSIVLHTHAATMGAWLLLLLTQAVLAASGRLALHRRIGSAAFVLAPLVVVATTFPETYEIEPGHLLLWLAPIVIYDWLKNGRLHRAYVIGLLCVAPLMLATHLLWNSPTWHALAPRIIGVEGW